MTLKVNCRTCHQIRSHADRLLGPESSDVDGNKVDRRSTVWVFNGVSPKTSRHENPEAEIQAVSQSISALAQEGFTAQEIGVFVRSAAELEKAIEAVGRNDLRYRVLDKDMEILPSQARIETAAVASGLDEVHETERHSA